MPVTTVSAEEVAGWLRAGKVVVVPTETVYGLAVRAGDPEGLRRVFALKDRPAEVNLPVLIGHPDQLAGLGVDFDPVARALAERFWPGPLTLVMGFEAAAERPAWLAGRVEVAVRLPDLELLRRVAELAGPLLLTSANRHGTGPKTSVAEAVASLAGEVDAAVDAGVLSSVPSTIVNTRRVPPVVERVGSLASEEVRRAIEAAPAAGAAP
ncbi:MAG TPA: L-threonylcarbamoyladenylate synthase [Thermoanaerobaculia bacterium]|nr:L-threonylcarbamoyladenylate synthase [Thermoanaerobaculia bacterium]